MKWRDAADWNERHEHDALEAKITLLEESIRVLKKTLSQEEMELKLTRERRVRLVRRVLARERKRIRKWYGSVTR